MQSSSKQQLTVKERGRNNSYFDQTFRVSAFVVCWRQCSRYDLSVTKHYFILFFSLPAGLWIVSCSFLVTSNRVIYDIYIYHTYIIYSKIIYNILRYFRWDRHPVARNYVVLEIKVKVMNIIHYSYMKYALYGWKTCSSFIIYYWHNLVFCPVYVNEQELEKQRVEIS